MPSNLSKEYYLFQLYYIPQDIFLSTQEIHLHKLVSNRLPYLEYIDYNQEDDQHNFHLSYSQLLTPNIHYLHKHQIVLWNMPEIQVTLKVQSLLDRFLN